jgi:hypothetical protein
VKKCSSCTKDLPDAALHCVFCGAKQAAAPIQQQNAKTVMGYSATDMIEQLKAQGLAVPGQPPAGQATVVTPPGAPYQPPGASYPGSAAPQAAPYQAPQAAPYQPPGASYPGPAAPQAAPYQAPQAAPYQAPAAAAASYPPAQATPQPYADQGSQPYQVPGQQAYGQPYGAPAAQVHDAPSAPNHNVPVAPAMAQTMFVEQAAPPRPGLGGMPATQIEPSAMSQPGQPAYQPPGQPAYQPPGQPAYQPPGQPAYQPVPVAQPIPAAAPPYLASQTAHRAGRPVEPWKDSLRLMMFIFGVLLLGAFATPLTTDPMSFQWDAILHGEGTAKLWPLILAATGLLSVVFAATPLQPAGRGVMAAILGLTGVVVPVVLASDTAWQHLVPMVGMILLIPGLLIRAEYRDAILPRLMVTIGALATLAPLLIPAAGTVPLVAAFQGVINAEGTAKVPVALELGQLVIVVLALLAWLPAPSSGGAKVFAWLLLLWGVVTHGATIALAGGLGDKIPAAPNATLMAWAPGMAFAVLIGYGLATVFGKQLE